MKIGIFTNNYLPNPYGVSQSIESFRQELESRGHEIFIFAPDWKGYEDENPRAFRYPSVDIEYKIKFPLAVPYSKKLDKILESLDLDVIHSQHPNLLGSAAMKWAKKKNIPIVFTWHTLYDKYAHFFPIIPPKLSAGWAIRNARDYANRCDWVVVPTSSVKSIIENWGVTNKNIEIIPTGVEEIAYADPDGERIRKKFGIKNEEVLLLLISRLTEEKNVEFLFQAVIPILRKNSRVKFLAAGDGDLVSRLKKMSEESGIGERIFFEGIVPKDEIKNYYAAGDIFVYASKSETQGMILTEAMYSGLPIVTVRATGAEDIILDGETGFLVSENEAEFVAAAEKLIADENLRKRFSEDAKRVAREKYTSSICAEKMWEVYKKAIEAQKKNDSNIKK